MVYPILAAILGLVVGVVAGYLYRASLKGPDPQAESEKLLAEARQEAARIRESATTEVEQHKKAAELEVAERLIEKEKKAERDIQKRHVEMERTEGRIKKREEGLDRREENITRREQSLTDREKAVEGKLAEAETAAQSAREAKQLILKRAEEVSGMTAEQAKKLLLDQLESEVRQEAAALVSRIEGETRETAEKKARQLITLAAQKCATDQISETTVSVVHLPNEEMKGRIIGREGRNIRALEQATGVNFIVDDTPEAVVLSCFDPMRREIARLVLEKLIADGRIHPARIEEIVEKTEREVMETARLAGENACMELGIHDMHPELIKLLGRLRYRTSYGQNVLAHSVECAHIAEVLSSELGLDAKLAKRATLLHDIGKAVTFEQEGTHASIGAELARKNRERPEVVHAIEAHHYEVEPRTLTAIIVITADSVSAARPGARRESLESYIKRLENLEKIANEFEGVEKSYALQAGREVRVVVNPTKLNDNECSLLARNITKKIEGELQYPGQIKVTVFRETRSTEYAR